MDLLVTCQSILAIIAMAFLYNFWLFSPAGGKKGGEIRPPEPAGAWPVVGHLPLLGGSTEAACRTLGRLADQYGPVFILRLGAHRTLVVGSQEAARECFTACDRDFASRPRSAAGKYLGYDHTMLGLAPYGPHWREMRKIVTVELLSSARLEKLRHIWTGEVNTRMGELYELCCAVEGGQHKVEMKQWFQDTNFNVVVRMVVGRRYIVDGTAGDDGGQMRRFQKGLTRLLYLVGVFVPSDAVPWLEWLDLKGYIKAMKKTASELDSVVATWIEEHRQKRRSAAEPGRLEGGQDFIDVMLSTMEGVDLSGPDADTVIKGTVLNVILGGTDTSSITMTWALALLLNHPRVLSKLREELDLQVGRDRNVEEADVRQLPYLQAVMKETMRLYPVAPLSVPHEATADCVVGGYRVPAGTRLLTNLWKLQRHPGAWPDPEEFRPERFLPGGEAAELDVRGQHFEYIPFGSGRRICPGITFAMLVMQLTLARLVHDFEMKTPEGAPVDMAEGLGLNLTKAAPMEVLFTPRLAPHLYQN